MISSRMLLAGTAAILLGGVAIAPALDPASLGDVVYHPSGIAYWDTPYFADAMMSGGGWMAFADGQWGTGIPSWNQPEFNEFGFPQEMMPGLRYRFIPYGLHTDPGPRPDSWPARGRLAQGKIVLAWQGEADIRLAQGGTYLAGESSGAATGLLADGRRVYSFTGGRQLSWMEVWDINAADPITDIDIWLSNPADPQNSTLEGELFHPTFLDRLEDAEWTAVRFMGWSNTNGNPEQDWPDRRRPGHAFQAGDLNPRAPAPGYDGPRPSGAAWELMVAACNEADLDLWINVPHLATDEYIRNLARLIRFGSDGDQPYTEAQEDPVWAPLEPGLRVFVEYSNEIWSNGWSFPQGDWAQAQATAAGITKGQFNGRRFAEVFSIFQDIFGGPEDLVRVAAAFTANENYNQDFLQEMATYGPTLDPPAQPDAIAVTTYFGNGIQDWAFQQAAAQAGTDDPWFFTTETFDPGNGSARPVTVSVEDGYWSGDALERHLQASFDEWEYRMLSGDAREGAGPDAVGIGGGFGEGIRQMARTTFDQPVPIIAYEGGPSLYTDGYDWGDSRDDGVTIFMEALNRHPRFATIYNMHLNMAKARGLWAHSMFTDSGAWGKYGQWGHLEYPDQEPADSPKYQFLLDWIAEQPALRHVDAPAGAVPGFVTEHNLPTAVYGAPYAADIETAGGDGTRIIRHVASSFVDGLAIDPGNSALDRLRIAGTSAEGGRSFVYLRVADTDGDPAWRTFTIRSVGGPETILEANFEGSNLAGNVPWMPTYISDGNIAYGGLRLGSGIIPHGGENALIYSQNMPANEADSTLALAIAENEYIAATITPADGYTLDLAGKEMRFAIRRLSYHAPRRYAVLTSVGGFADGAEIYETNWTGDETDQEYRFTFPETVAYESITGPMELRIYGFSGQYGGHRTSVTEFRVDGVLANTQEIAKEGWQAF